MEARFSLAARIGCCLLLSLLAGLAVVPVGCGGNSAAGQPSPDGSAVIDDVAIDGETAPPMLCPTVQNAPSFAHDVKPFLDAHCTACHSIRPRDGGFAPSAQNFETYAGFKPWAWEALASLHQKTMPPPESDAPVTASDICVIESWIDQGANDN